MDVSVIIVNYNTSALTLQCLHTLYEYTSGVSFEVIVVDNYSSDDSVSLIEKNFPQVTLLKSDVNLGFGRANNLAARQARGKYLFLLNSDAIVISNIIKVRNCIIFKIYFFIYCSYMLQFFSFFSIIDICKVSVSYLVIFVS